KAKLEQARTKEEQAKASQEKYFSSLALADRFWQNNLVAHSDRVLAECPAELRHWEWFHQKRRCNPSIVLAQASAEPISCIAWSPDGTYLATTGRSKARTKIWQADGLKFLHAKSVYHGLSQTMAFCPATGQLAYAWIKSGEETRVGW